MTGLAGGTPERHEPQEYRFRSSHRGLAEYEVRSRGPDGLMLGSGCDAIVVLNHSHARRARFAIDLATDVGCPVLVLGTGGWARSEVWSRAPLDVASGDGRHVVRLLWPAPWDGIFPSGTLRHVADEGLKYQDISAKRNIALAVARMLGWRSLLFLDDDITGLTAEQLRGPLPVGPDRRPSILAWAYRQFPDNSVVCHARREVGLTQDTFVGAGALLVDVDEDVPFFPPVYNEDWLFFFDLLARGRPLVVMGHVQQRRFDPFEYPRRAYEEEPGDILAEGLFELLHLGGDVATATAKPYWADLVAGRREMIKDLRRRASAMLTERAGAEQVRWYRVLGSLAAAERHHDDTDLPAHLASFVRAWRADLDDWHEWFAGLPQDVPDLPTALRLLGISDEVLLPL
jgi:hypothetical protein